VGVVRAAEDVGIDVGFAAADDVGGGTAAVLVFVLCETLVGAAGDADPDVVDWHAVVEAAIAHAKTSAHLWRSMGFPPEWPAPAAGRSPTFALFGPRRYA
jgi:hypothetical protein